MHIPPTLSFLLPLLPLTTALLPTHLIYQAPLGSLYENLAIRPSGSILLTSITSSNLYLLNPASPNPTPSLIHTFSSALWLLGITETKPDTYHLVAANGTLKTLSPTPGSNRIYTVSFSPNCSDEDPNPEISLTATLPDAQFLNGMTTLSPSAVLVADSKKGVVWAVDIQTGTSRIAISHPLFLPTPTFAVGINGIRLHDHNLYFTNTALALFARIPINLLDGTATGPAVNISTAPAGASYDDFAISKGGERAFLVTSVGNSLEEVVLKGKGEGGGVIVAGDLNSTVLAEPTSCAFGRGRGKEGVLYVTTGGGLIVPVNGDETVGAQVVGVEVGRR